jgi:arylsulfatase A-like enzyme
MYLHPRANAQLFAFAVLIYVFLALVLTLPLAIAVWLLTRCTPWPRMIVFRTVFGGISAATFVLILIRDIKLWLQRLDIVSIHLGRDKWILIAFVLGVCMLAAYRQSHVLTGMLRWATVSTLCVLAFAGVFYLSFLMSTLIHPGDTLATSSPPGRTHGMLTRPNIVLVTIDTFSARHSSVYGYTRETTPALEQLARQASTFTAFYANSNFTNPGVNSLLYGVRPWTHRAYMLGDPSSAQFSLAAQLHQAGYTTLAVISNGRASPALNLTQQYFDKSVDCAMRYTLGYCLIFHMAPPEAVLLSALQFVIDWTIALDTAMVRLGLWSPTDHFDPELVLSQARQMLRARRVDRPFFLWVHLFSPHVPYAAPAPFLGHFDAGPFHRTRFDSSPPDLFAAGEDPTFPEAYIGRYDESLMYVDYHVGQFFDWLKQNQLFDGALIVITADHGESFSRGYGTHAGPLLHNDLIHIPLLLKQPHQTQGQRINAVAEQIDLMPTILDMVGISAQGHLEGKSLQPILRGEVQPFDRPIFSMNFMMNSRFGPLQTGTVAMIDGRWKYVHYCGYAPSAALPALQDELYDLEADPYEEHNVIAQQVDIAAHMKAAIALHLRIHGGRRG